MVDKLNRREFISATAVAGAAMLLEACKSDSGEQTAAIKKSSLNTINSGQHNQQHSASLCAIGGGNNSSCADMNRLSDRTSSLS